MNTQHTPIRATLAHIGLRHDDPEQLAHFYEDVMGLCRQETNGDKIRLGWGVGHHALEISPGPTGLDHIAFELPHAGELEELVQRLSADGHEVAEAKPGGDHPVAHVVHDPDGHRLELFGRIDRSGEHTADPGRRPIRVQHVTVASPNMEAMVAFYEQVLGFRVSDRMGDIFTWLRSDRAHHTLAVVAASEVGLDHYSYDVGGWEDFKVWCDTIANQGWEVGWGPGRHGPGNNLFIIFPDAAGIRVELSAEMELYWDDRSDVRPRHWQPGARTVNLWGPVPDWRTV